MSVCFICAFTLYVEGECFETLTFTTYQYLSIIIYRFFKRILDFYLCVHSALIKSALYFINI